jgi:hypothetical protein
VSHKTERDETCRTFPRAAPSVLLTNPERGMSTDQRASEKVGQLVQNAFESLLQVNTCLERLQDLIGLGMDVEQLLAPHAQVTWKFLVPQEKRLQENWGKFISAVESANLNAATGLSLQQTVAEAAMVESAPTPFPVTVVRIPEKVTPVVRVEVRWFS